MSPRWHVVSWYQATYPDEPENHPKKEERVWTISLKPDVTGWENDCDCHGYGLTWAQATELADAANLDWREPTKYMLDCAAEDMFPDLPHVIGMQRARRVFSTMYESYLREKGIDA